MRLKNKPHWWDSTKEEFQDRCRTRGMRNARRQQVSYCTLLHYLKGECFKGVKSLNKAANRLVDAVVATEYLMMRGHETWTVTVARRINLILLIQDMKQGLVWFSEEGYWDYPHQENIYGSFKEEQ